MKFEALDKSNEEPKTTAISALRLSALNTGNILGSMSALSRTPFSYSLTSIQHRVAEYPALETGCPGRSLNLTSCPFPL
jgi:hypothetical protein